jgi:hypothetical protein
LGGLHPFKDGAYDAADYTAFGSRLRAPVGHIFLKLVSETGDGQGLEPDAAGTHQRGEEDAVATEDHVTDAGNALDLEADAGLEGADVAGMDAECLAGGQVFDDDLAGELQPGDSLPVDLLQEEAVAAKDARAEGLLKADAKLYASCGTEEAVTMDEVLVAGTDFDGDDMTGDACGKGYLTRGADGTILRHEERAATGDAP